MSYLILQPDGKYALWSTSSDEFSTWGIDRSQIVEVATMLSAGCSKCQRERYERHLTTIDETGLAWEHAMNWDEATRYVCYTSGPDNVLLREFRAAGLPVTEPRRCPICAKGYQNVHCGRCKRHVCDKCGYLPDLTQICKECRRKRKPRQ